jgi:hypothetical protein
MTDVPELEPSLRESSLQRRYARGRAAVEQGDARVALDEIAADVPAQPLVEEVDRGMSG